MTGITHKKFATAYGLVAIVFIYTNGVLSLNYYVTIPIILMFAVLGGKFPDLDHDWDYVSNKNLLTFVINKAIHMTGGKHRSWQTHSLDICLVFLYIAYKAPKIMLSSNIINSADFDVIRAMALGFTGGWLSHLMADAMTPGGIRILFWVNKKIAFVPHKGASLVNFKTGSKWEELIGNIIGAVNQLGTLAVLAYPILKGRVF